jgi:5-(carboxyamino)imidazole ribonucleotide synthase
MNKIAFIGAGQLALMTLPHAHRLGLLTVTVDTKTAPAHQLSHEQVIGDIQSIEVFHELLKIEGLTHVTLDIEHVSLDGLRLLESAGLKVSPSSRTLEVIQDKLKQRHRLQELGIPGPAFRAASVQEIDPEEAAVVKLPTGGYDGRGVWPLKKGPLPAHFCGSLLVEEEISIDKELAILIARNEAGQLAFYDPVEMLFDERLNLMATLFAPARIEDDLALQMKSYAQTIIEGLDYTGILAVEFFLTTEGALLVNEVAPRPHNSGHHTQVAADTDQFEQHLRAVMNWPLGESSLKSYAYTFNLLGESTGRCELANHQQWLGEPALFYQWYGKQESRPGRKLGHVTLTRPLNLDSKTALEQLISQKGRLDSCLKIQIQ